MDKDFKHIDSIYKNAFADFNPQIKTDAWKNISTKANRVRFFKFNLTRFNFYYAALITTTFLASLTVFVDYFFIAQTKNEPSVKTEPSKNINSEVPVTKSIDIIYEPIVAKKEIIKHKIVSEKDVVHSLGSTIKVSVNPQYVEQTELQKPNNKTLQEDIEKESVIDSNYNEIIAPDKTEPLIIDKSTTNKKPKQFKVQYEKVIVRDTVYRYKKKRDKSKKKLNFGLFK